MSFGQWLHDEMLKGKALAKKFLDEFDTIDTAIDTAAPTVEQVTGVFYPPAVVIEKAFVGVMDAAAAAIRANTTVGADGAVSLTLSPDVVSQVKAVVAAGDAAYQAVVHKP